MAKRLLVAFLALLGLAAQIAPAQARVCAGAASAVGEVMLAQQAEGAQAASELAGVRPETPAVQGCREAMPLADYRVPASVPVLTGIDRARE
jgi:hypothetical protein